MIGTKFMSHSDTQSTDVMTCCLSLVKVIVSFKTTSREGSWTHDSNVSHPTFTRYFHSVVK